MRDARRGRALGKAEQGAETRANLLRVARELFGQSGYADTSTEKILAAAEITRGALYHHFADKADLLRAVCEEAYAEVAQRIEKRARRTDDAWQSLVEGCDTFLEVASEPALVRVLFLDGPAVLGRGAWNELERRHGLRSLVEGVGAAISAGEIARQPVEPLAILLNGALNEAVYWVSQQSDRNRALGQVRRALHRLLEALRAPADRR